MQTARNNPAIQFAKANPAPDNEPAQGRELVKLQMSAKLFSREKDGQVVCSIQTGSAFSAFSEALLHFNEDAVVYCQSIHESAAHDYAADYRRMLQNCAKGLEEEQPGIPADLFEPNRKLIQSMLERIYEKYFPARIRTSNPVRSAKCG
jgi:hypothetical protein